MKELSYALAVLVLSASPLLAGSTFQPPAQVPEPATMALLAGGAAMLGVVAWRRKGR
jgi:hypothetical protein